MVVISAAMYFPEQARAIMRQVPAPENQPPEEWEAMRKRHKLGDQQIVALWNWTREMKDSYDDMNFTPPSLSRITARTLIVMEIAIHSIPLRWPYRCIARYPVLPSGWSRTAATGLFSPQPHLSSHKQRLRSLENRLNRKRS
jgi:hypothetical protein